MLNAKSITLKELYGVLDPDSRDWTDGLLSKIYRNANVPPAPDASPVRQWILFDGDVDAIWIENMNTVQNPKTPYLYILSIIWGFVVLGLYSSSC